MSTSTVQGRAVTGGPGEPRGGTGARVARGLGAVLLLVVLLAGIPAGLWIFGGPVWTGPVSLNQIISTLSTPDVTGSVLLGLIKIVGWIAWLTFAIAVMIEAVAAIRGRRSPQVRGLGAQQRAAAVLVSAVISMLVAGPVASAATVPTSAEAGPTETVATASISSETGAPTGATDGAKERAKEGGSPSATYTVQPGDSLWRIAEQTLGDGARFKQIADLNYGVRQGDGGALDAGNWIEPGWVLKLPAATGEGAGSQDSTGGGTNGTPDVSSDTVEANPGSDSAEIVVERGDTLWGIAEEELGDGTKYPEVFEASRATEQPGGARLTDPDLILPGWTVTVPGADEPSGQPSGESERSPADADGSDTGGAADETSNTASGTGAGSGTKADEQPAPSTEVTPEGAVDVKPDGIQESAPAGGEVVDEAASGGQPAGEQPVGEASATPDPNRAAEKAGPKAPTDDAGGTSAPDAADAVTGTAGVGAPGAEEPAPEKPADGSIVPKLPPAPKDTAEPEYDEVTPEDLRNDPDLELDESAPQDDSSSDAIPGSELIADELMPQEEPVAEEASSASGTTWGSDPASDDIAAGVIADELMPQEDFAAEDVSSGTGTAGDIEGPLEEPAAIVPESEAMSVDGSTGDEVQLDEMMADEVPVAGDNVPEVAIESSPLVESAPVDSPLVDSAPVASAPVGASADERHVSQPDVVLAAASAASGDSGSPLDSAAEVVSDVADDLDESVGVRTAVGVGGLLAAGLIALVAVKRGRARKGREPGETIVVPGPDTPAGALERELRTVEDPFGRIQVDRALRSLALWYRERDLPLPGVSVARLKSGEFVELYLDSASDLPEPWASTTDRFVWQLSAADADAAARVADGSTTVPATEEGEAPYPALVTVGHDDEDAHIMLDLENLACLDIRGTDTAAQATLAALAVELATSLWADDLQVTVVGTLGELPGVVDTGRVRHVPSLAGIVHELEARASDVDRTLGQVGATSVADARGRGLATDAWTPEILLVGEHLGAAERAKLEDLVERVPGVGIAAVTSSAEVGDWVLDLTGELTHGDTNRGILMPGYIALRPQQLDAATYAQALALLADPETVPGPVWSSSIDRSEPTLEEIPMDVVRAGAVDVGTPAAGAARLAPSRSHVAGAAGHRSVTPTGAAARFSPWATAAVSVATPPFGTPVVSRNLVVEVGSAPAETGPAPGSGETAKPVVRVLGTVELGGATGVELPSTHQRQATELIAFLAFNPGSRGSDISKALWPAREPNLATRRSAVSRARRWLGTDADGYEYLPRYWSADDGGQADLESAGYRLRGVTTDWRTFCDLAGSDITETPTPDLLAALELVRGRPFEGVPLRKYAWAEQLMHTISSGIVDVSHEVARRALLEGDVATARHASQVGRLADPVDERSWRNGIRAEIASGRRDAAGRLVDRLRDHLEQLAMEPEPDTEELLAQMDEQDRLRGADSPQTPRQ